MHTAERLNHRPIFHDDMPCECHRVSELRVVADPNIVRHVRVSHQQIVIADGRRHATALSAAMDRHEFANLIAIADPRFGPLAVIFQILRRDADGRVWKK